PATSARAIARPMPREPPVTIATLPRSDSIPIRIVHRMHEVAIVGAGELGGAIAHAVARGDLVRRITIVDETGRVAAGKALDIAQAGPVEGFATELAGSTDLAALAGAPIVVIADCFGAGEWQGEDQLTLLRRIAQMTPDGVVIAAGASGRSLVERGVRELKLSSRRLVGTAPESLAGSARALGGPPLQPSRAGGTL